MGFEARRASFTNGVYIEYCLIGTLFSFVLSLGHSFSRYHRDQIIVLLPTYLVPARHAAEKESRCKGQKCARHASCYRSTSNR